MLLLVLRTSPEALNSGFVLHLCNLSALFWLVVSYTLTLNTLDSRLICTKLTNLLMVHKNYEETDLLLVSVPSKLLVPQVPSHYQMWPRCVHDRVIPHILQYTGYIWKIVDTFCVEASVWFVAVPYLFLLISFRVTSLALGQSYDCPSACEVTLKNMGQQITGTHEEYSYIHNKTQ